MSILGPLDVIETPALLGTEWSRAVDVLARAHLRFLVEGALVAVGLGLLLALVPVRMARMRYALACLALLGTAVLPLHDVLAGLARPAAAAPLAEHAQSAAPASLRTLPAAAREGPALVAGAQPGLRAAKDAVRALPRELAARLDPVRPWLVALWLLGVGWLSVRNLNAWKRARALERLGTFAAPEQWERRLERLRAALGLRRAVRLLVSARIDGPLVLGFLRPVVLVPGSALTGLSVAELEAVLAHELAHVRRHDALVNLLQVGVETLLFYHPAVWWISRQVRVTREHCCDDVAVAACGDRTTYVRALARLEQDRAPTVALALPAGGDGLASRMRRVLAREEHPRPRNQRIQGVGTMLALALVLAGTFHLTSLAPLTPAPRGAQPQESRRVPAALELPEQHGLWMARLENGRLHLELRTADEHDGMWGSSLELTDPQLSGLDFGDAVTFRLTRDAGTFTFTGDLRGDAEHADGTGRWVLAPDASYVAAMGELGYRDLGGHDLFRLASLDVSRAFVHGLRELGYDLSLDMLIKMAIHGASPEYVRALVDAGYRGLEPEQLVKMRIHDVTPEYARGMASLAGGLVPAEELVSLSIHDVSPEFAREVRQLGYETNDLGILRQLRIHDVTPEYIRGIESSLGERVPLETLIQLSIHDVDEPWMGDMRARFGQLHAQDLIQLRIHDVEAQYLDDLATLGYTPDSSEAIQMRIHRVTPEWVRDLQAKGLVNLTIQELIRRRIHGDDD